MITINYPIFIVGAPRSGTTLLSAFLASHSRIACGPESQLFNKLKPQEVKLALKDSTWPDKATNLITSLTLSGQSVYKLFDLTVDEVRNYLKNKEPSERTLLESLTAQHAQKMGKPRWAEKTPNHLLHLPLIRKLFPESPILRIIRDPRDSAMSMRKLPWASQSILANCHLWNEWFSSSHTFCMQDKKTLTIRYEDLVLNPKTILSEVCEHIGEDFEETMLDTSKSAISVSSPNEHWKAQVSQPLDPSRLYVWKKELSSDLLRATTYICQPGIEAFDYDQVEEPKAMYFVYQLNRDFIEKNESLILTASNKGKRLVPITKHQIINQTYSANKKIFICNFPKVVGSRSKKLITFNLFIFYLLVNRLRGYSIFYFNSTITSQESTFNSFLGLFCLKVLSSETYSI